MALSRRTKIIVAVGALVLMSLAITGYVLATRKDIPEVTAYKIEKRRDLSSTVTASGEIRPIQYINLTSEVAGRIQEIYVKEGDPVNKGQQLVKLDPTQLQTNQDAQLAAYQSAQNEIQVSRSQVTAAQNQYAQAQQSLIATEASVDTARQQVASAQQQVAQAQERLNTSRQGVVSAQTDIDRAQVELNAANRELKRSTELLENGVISKLEFDNAKDRLENAQVALRTAQANLETRKLAVNESQAAVKQAQLGVNEAQSRVKESISRANQQRVSVRDAQRGITTAGLSARSSEDRARQQAAFLRGQTDQKDKTLQLAPLNGIVAEIPSKVGTFATANFSSTPLMTIADMTQVNVEVKVDETEIDKVSEGQVVKVKVDAFNGKEIDGTVTQKTPLAVGKSATSGGLSNNINVQEAKEFRVVIRLSDSMVKEIKEGLRPGMSATATITTKTVKDLVAIPLQAVIEKAPEKKEAAEGSPLANTSDPIEKPKPIVGVYLLDGNKVKFVEITKGINGESDIEITSGLSEGQEVITGPSRVLKTLKEGDIVKRQTKKDGENANK